MIYYVDNNGVYQGGFEGEHGVDVSSFTVVPGPPSNAATDTWVNNAWIEVAESLEELKQRRYNEIDMKTGMLIGAGFVYNSNNFSLSSHAQFNWEVLKQNKNDFIFPKKISKKDNSVYELAFDEVETFWLAAKNVVDVHLDNGANLKQLIVDAVDKAEVAAVIDNR